MYSGKFSLVPTDIFGLCLLMKNVEWCCGGLPIKIHLWRRAVPLQELVYHASKKALYHAAREHWSERLYGHMWALRGTTGKELQTREVDEASWASATAQMWPFMRHAQPTAL